MNRIETSKTSTRASIAAAMISTNLLIATPDTSHARIFEGPGKIQALGERTLAIIPIEFDDGQKSISVQEGRSIFFEDPASVNSIFISESFDKFRFKGRVNPLGDVLNPAVIHNTIKDCSRSEFEEIVENAYSKATVSQPEYDIKNYRDYVFIMPQQAKCDFGGVSVGNTILTNIEPKNLKQVSVHELGHNLGLNHSNELHCGSKNGRDTVDKGICMIAPYNDKDDWMGGTSSEAQVPWRAFSGFNKARLGWVSMKTIKKDQNVIIAPINKPSRQIHAARIRIGGTKEWPEYLYFDYKILPHISIDGSKTLATSGLSIRRANGLGKENAISAFAPETELYDMHPKSSSLLDARLAKGMHFVTKEGVSIKVLSANSEYLRFAINGINNIKPLKKTTYSMK